MGCAPFFSCSEHPKVPRYSSVSRDFPDERWPRRSGPRPALLNTHWTPAEIPCQRKNDDKYRSGRQAGCPTGRPDGLPRLVPRPVSLTSPRTIPLLLGSTPLPSARSERSPGTRHRAQPTDPHQDRREQHPGHGHLGMRQALDPDEAEAGNPQIGVDLVVRDFARLSRTRIPRPPRPRVKGNQRDSERSTSRMPDRTPRQPAFDSVLLQSP